MVTDTERRVRSATVTCHRCSSVAPFDPNNTALAHHALATSTDPATRARALDPDEVAEVAAVYSARDADWERDTDARTDGPSPWLCPTCAEVVASERRHPCPSWCTHCDGYDFFSEGTTHRHSWFNAAGVLVAEVTQNVPFNDDVEGWMVATLFQQGPEEKNIAGLREAAALANEVADFAEAHGLVLTTEDE